ncbi:1-deoxy-D-xylulose-5-phosphate synthase [candidate division WOR-1 bacterium RIFCSPLOWO2_02_FULL_46_20]|uniref:1-deoxy-D-xylulose-5-phosphate synthase n=1 Tax=candidate division WOR-1 bacterium RIFCSPLOWO2_02_FULL_46_20 TaxID=1802567 RepID=A0A1F4R8M8_UNCSA|nr:MAG: 1-deoxy-D-xylulose-5-phosphate synthase [candidate division WOR-1 bacterium RIFCSPLOWO2_02_FULL_46_20]
MSTLLDKIKLPEGLRELSGDQLARIAREVRQKIIESASKTGGHLASSLGAVELTVALHSTFESPKDKIIWDVGHQAYAHKILTGRLEQIHTLRTKGGLSGFPKPEESPHDAFAVGHASTSISAALGMARARDFNKEDYSVVAVIGDGSLSGGLAFEGINNASTLKTNLVVILNDNEMSISKNVGALANYLVRVSTSNLYVDLRNRIEQVVKKIPGYGVSLFEAAKKLKDRTKHIVLDFKVDVIFEEFGFKYFGPIDGHNIPLIISTLHHAREIKGPVLIHVLTKKGKGYEHAEKEPSRFHGVGPFDPANGQSSTRGQASYTSIFGQTIVKLGERDKKIVGITAAMVDGTGLEEFAKKFPERFFDVGIAEEHAVTFAAGLAISGYRPFVAIYSTFFQRSFDQIIHDVCLQNLPVTFCLDRAGVVGEDGPTHHGLFDLSYLRLIPNMVVMAPKDENELQLMLFTASKHNGPIAVRYPRGGGPGVELETEFKQMEIGKGEIFFKSQIPNPKSKQCMVSIGSMVYPSIEAAKLLEKDGIAVTVINARFVKPLDKDLILKEAESVDKIITVEEGGLEGGFGSAVLELLTEVGINTPVKRIGLPTKFIEQAKRSELLESYGLTAEGIYKQC